MILRTTCLLLFILLFPFLMGKDKPKRKTLAQIQSEMKEKVKSICEEDIPVANKKAAIKKYLKIGLKALRHIKKRAIRRRKFDDARVIQTEMKELKSKKSYWLKQYYALIGKQQKGPLSIKGHVLNYNNYWDMTLEDRQKTVKKYTLKNKYGLYQFNGKHFNVCSENNDAHSLEMTLSLEVFEKGILPITQFVPDLKVTIYIINSSQKLAKFTFDNFKYTMDSQGVYVSKHRAIFMSTSPFYLNSTLLHEAAHHLYGKGVLNKVQVVWLGEGAACMVQGWLLDCDLETNLFLNNFISVYRYHLMLSYRAKKCSYSLFEKILNNPRYSAGGNDINHSYAYYWSIVRAMYNDKTIFNKVLEKSIRFRVGSGYVFPEIETPLKKKVFALWMKYINDVLSVDDKAIGLLLKALENIYLDLPYKNGVSRKGLSVKRNCISSYYQVRNNDRVIKLLKPKMKDHLIYQVVYSLHLFCKKKYKEALVEFLKLEKDYYRLSFLYPLIGKCYLISGDKANANIFFDKALKINQHNHLVKKYKSEKN